MPTVDAKAGEDHDVGRDIAPEVGFQIPDGTEAKVWRGWSRST
jgi:hypothetical protein